MGKRGPPPGVFWMQAPLCRRPAGPNSTIFSTSVTELDQRSDTALTSFYAGGESVTSALALEGAQDVSSPYLFTTFAREHSWSATSQDTTPHNRLPPCTTVWMLAAWSIHKVFLHRGTRGMGGLPGQTRLHLLQPRTLQDHR